MVLFRFDSPVQGHHLTLFLYQMYCNVDGPRAFILVELIGRFRWPWTNTWYVCSVLGFGTVIGVRCSMMPWSHPPLRVKILPYQNTTLAMAGVLLSWFNLWINFVGTGLTESMFLFLCLPWFYLIGWGHNLTFISHQKCITMVITFLRLSWSNCPNLSISIISVSFFAIHKRYY